MSQEKNIEKQFNRQEWWNEQTKDYGIVEDAVNMMPHYTPLGSKVLLVRFQYSETKTSGGIIIPESGSMGKPIGVIVALGNSTSNHLKIGQMVHYTPQLVTDRIGNEREMNEVIINGRVFVEVWEHELTGLINATGAVKSLKFGGFKEYKDEFEAKQKDYAAKSEAMKQRNDQKIEESQDAFKMAESGRKIIIMP